ncbi:hypothetical protein C8J28_1072 [Cereibacter azotoformans]|uniref:Transposase InsH N-terminal domain-containing protein n=1 Tax=Cereibacter azotoformans TaxID=43057 RepID=A0A2T5K866_9RHOB|nr:hypothetical protein C8J28_1072 [Cereibacter azotoformans]
MKHRPCPPEQNDLFRPRLVDMIDMRHELVTLAGLIDWEFFDREWAGFFPSITGRPATSPRLVAGLLYLKHPFRLSDEAVVARWVERRCCRTQAWGVTAPYPRMLMPRGRSRRCRGR